MQTLKYTDCTVLKVSFKGLHGYIRIQDLLMFSAKQGASMQIAIFITGQYINCSTGA